MKWISIKQANVAARGGQPPAQSSQLTAQSSKPTAQSSRPTTRGCWPHADSRWLIALSFLIAASLQAQQPWKKGILVDEFVFEKASFKESHAATIAETPKGLVIAWFGGTKERNPDVEIRVSRQVNGKWSAPVSAASGVQNDTSRLPTWNPVLFQIPGGKLLLFYKIGPSPSTWKGWLKTSSDHGASWSAAQPLPAGFIGPVKNKPVMVGKTLLCPSSTEGNGWKVHFEASDDEGKTWRMIGPISDGKTLNAIQPSILTYKDGRLQILARSRNRAVVESWSNDGGKTWSPLAKTSLPNNNSGTDAVSLKDGRQLLVYNHVLPPGTEAKGPRTPLNLSYTKDGKEWFASAVLEDSPISQYSYPSIIQGSDGMVHVVYTWRRERIKYAKVDPSRLEGKKIIDGKWPQMEGYTAPKPIAGRAEKTQRNQLMTANSRWPMADSR